MKILVFFLSITSLLVYAQGGLHSGDISSMLEGLKAIEDAQKISCDVVPGKNTIALKDFMKREQVSFPFTTKCRDGWFYNINMREEMAELLRKSLYEYGLSHEEAFIEAGLRKVGDGDQSLTQFNEVKPMLNSENYKKEIEFPEKKAWLDKIASQKSAQDRCELLKLAMIHAIWTVDTIRPIRKINTMSSLFYDSKTALASEKEAYEKDLHRALSSFRFLSVVPKEQFPSNCMMNEYGQELSVQEVYEKRYNFAANVPNMFGSSIKYPIGMSVGMCGRPMNSHYLDMEGNLSKELLDAMAQPWTVIEPDCK